MAAIDAVQNERQTLHRVVEDLPEHMVVHVLRLVELYRDSAPDHRLAPELIGDPQDLLQELHAGLADIEAGHLLDHDVVNRKARARLAEGVSPALAARPDAR
ncbi:MAG: hypothetical protein HY332_11985 [Chloroflexi bacterium]|nr:hypothetical protein [Chloroflexota bacterium]